MEKIIKNLAFTLKQVADLLPFSLFILFYFQINQVTPSIYAHNPLGRLGYLAWTHSTMR